MSKFVEIRSTEITQAVCKACTQANINLPREVFDKLLKLGQEGFEPSSKMSQILANASIADKIKRPLCQDTGQVIVFAQVGQDVKITGKDFKTAINKGVSLCYTKNFFRKSIVKNAIFDRTNTQDNMPAVIYTEIVKGKSIRLDILIKGGGAENMSAAKMFNPSASEKEIKDFVLDTVKASGTNACPPLFIGVGIGGTLDYAAVLSKKAFFKSKASDFEADLLDYLNKNSETKCADIKVLTAPTHIACLPVCVTLNCHSCRHASVLITQSESPKILTRFAHPKMSALKQPDIPEINTNEPEKLRALKPGGEILLTGEIYTARDAAHKKLVNMLENGENLPFDIKDKIIFYAGPCPANESEIIGPIGPTTSKRMDTFAPKLYDKGLLGTIGKGARSKEVEQSIKKNKAVYFTVQGGVASYLQKCIKSAKIVAFEELGPEAIYRLEVEKLPVKLN